MEYVFSDRVKDLKGNAIREIFKVLADKEMISFAGGNPASQLLPAEKIKEYAIKCLNENPTAVLQYGATEGYLPLRKAFIKYVERCGIKGIDVPNTLIVSGGQQGIDLMCKCFLNKGDRVLVQSPAYLAVLHIIKTYQGKAVGVKSSADGLDLIDLENKIITEKPKFLYLVPNFSNPSGKTLTMETRRGAYEICKKYGVLIVEDDPYREIRFSGTPIDSVKSLDDSGLVVYISSVSKTISPALRVGVVIADENIISKLTIGKQAVDVHTNTLSQAIVTEFLESGEIEKQIEKIVPVYKEKKDAFVSALKKHMPETFKFDDVDGGLFVFGEFTDGTSAREKFNEAIKNKVAYVCGNEFFADGSGENTIRLNYSNATIENINVGVERLGKIFKK